MKKVIIIPKDDLVKYPPTISLINILIKMKVEIVCIGIYSDDERRAAFEAAGVKFIPIYREIKDVSKNRRVNWICLLWRMYKYTSKMKQVLSSSEISKDDLIWFVYSNTIGYLQKYIERFEYVVQFYEFENFALDGKERFLHPSYDVKRFLTKAKALVHCEYNRAIITNGLYGVNKRFFILPNKPFNPSEAESLSMPEEIRVTINEIKERTRGKKVILYQGIFNSSERRLDEFCDAMSLLPDEYMFIAMGGGGGYFEEIKKKYSSDRIVFIPFIRPPYHLEITQLASYGVLTYHPANQSYVGVINPLYCAPNKIFEFGKYGIPMIANDVPGLKMIFSEYNCGKVVDYPITAQKIADIVVKMENEYSVMSKGAKAYYDSVDLEEIVNSIIEKSKK